MLNLELLLGIFVTTGPILPDRTIEFNIGIRELQPPLLFLPDEAINVAAITKVSKRSPELTGP